MCETSTVNTRLQPLPVLEFESEEQLQECLNWWKEQLFLDHWIIKGILVDPPLFDSNGAQLQGHNSFLIESNSALIEIVRPNEDMKSRVVKYCAEQILVHELLHCKYNWTKAPNTFEGIYCDVSEHSLLEQMAKTLIMVKYNLPLKWFQNF